MEKLCTKHGVVKHYERKPSGWRCSKCSGEAVTKRRKQLKLMAVEYLGGSCIFCGYNRAVEALDIHHTRDKEFGISDKGHTRSWDKLKEELEKCVLLCANCHREYHAGLIDIRM